jgi:hypothetical protein
MDFKSFHMAIRMYTSPDVGPARRGTKHISTVALLDAASASPDEQLQLTPVRAVDLATQPTIALIGSSRFSDPKWPANTTRRMVRNIADFIPEFGALNRVSSVSLQLPPYDLAVAAIEDTRAKNARVPIMAGIRAAKNVELLATPFVEHAPLHDTTFLADQYRLGVAIMNDLRLSPSTIGTLPRSAARLLGRSEVEDALRSANIESLLLQRSKSPYSYAPMFPPDSPVVNVVGETHSWPAFVTDPKSNNMFAAYLKGEIEMSDAVEALYGRIAAARDRSGYQLTVLRFPLELLSRSRTVNRLRSFLETMQGSSSGTIAIRSLSDCLEYVRAHPKQLPTVQHNISQFIVPNFSPVSAYSGRIDATIDALPTLAHERKILAMIALDRGFEEAAFNRGLEKDNILLDAVHNVLVGAAARGRDILAAMQAIPRNPVAPKLHQFGHAMLARYDSVASQYAHLL